MLPVARGRPFAPIQAGQDAAFSAASADCEPCRIIVFDRLRRRDDNFRVSAYAPTPGRLRRSHPPGFFGVLSMRHARVLGFAGIAVAAVAAIAAIAQTTVAPLPDNPPAQAVPLDASDRKSVV